MKCLLAPTSTSNGQLLEVLRNYGGGLVGVSFGDKRFTLLLVVLLYHNFLVNNGVAN